MMYPVLQSALASGLQRRRRFLLLCRLGLCWAVCAVISLALLAFERAIGWESPLTLPLVGIGAAVAGFIIWRRSVRQTPDWRELARRIEAEYPDLDGRLLTAVEQETQPARCLTYLQQRVIDEALDHRRRCGWDKAFPTSELAVAQAIHSAALACLFFVLWQLRVPAPHALLMATPERGVTITPGDTVLERGSSLVVIARFSGSGWQRSGPSKPGLVVRDALGGVQHLPLVRSLSDPLFGVTVPEVNSNLTYHLEYSGKQSREFSVTVFDYPRLERSDADLSFPAYTGLAPKHIDNTRRISAVEGSALTLQLYLNKPVALAQLVPKETNGGPINLAIPKAQSLPGVQKQAAAAPARAVLSNFVLRASGRYDLRLVDAEGRTNKVQSHFVLDALKNRPPEIKIASPRGDSRPSALEELTFEGTVWDDFGLTAYGLAYVVAGKEPQFLRLGENVPAKQQQAFKYVLPLEELGVKPNDLLSWFVWADDIDGAAVPRRTSGDLYFAEVRPFDEVFRQGPSMSAGTQQQAESGAEGGKAGKIAELQKQIISASWRVFRDQKPAGSQNKVSPWPDHRAETNRSSQVKPPTRPVVSLPTKTNQFAAHPSRPAGPITGATPASQYLERALRGQDRSSSHRLFLAQRTTPSPQDRRPRSRASREQPINRALTATNDLNVVLEAQSQALEQARDELQNQQDPRTLALWQNAVVEMEKALERLRQVTNSPRAFQEALAAEQAAYQALLKLQDREFSVSRSRSQQGSQSRNSQRQSQLDQLDLAQPEDRYETERQASAPQNEQRREQLQIMNRLQELARRQQDINERLKELQTALQEAKTEQEREQTRRELKRLQEEQQQLLADADEARQLMDKPENQSRLAEQRRQMEQARNDLQRATEAAQQGQTSQALAAGTRAERQLQDLRNDLRRQNAGEFDQELRQMRANARELARQQDELHKQMQSGTARPGKTLGDPEAGKDLMDRLVQQQGRLTNLLQSATQLSEQAESSEPLMARELYDTLRRFSQNDLSTLKRFQEELVNRGRVSRELYDRLKRMEQTGGKSLELTQEMLRQGYQQEAEAAEDQAHAGINDLVRGVERAAESVLGDDAESLRFAREQLDRLSGQLGAEIAQAEGGTTNATAGAAGEQRAGSDSNPRGEQAARSQPGPQETSDQAAGQPRTSSAGEPGQASSSQQMRRQGENEASPEPGGSQQSGRETADGRNDDGVEQADQHQTQANGSQPGPQTGQSRQAGRRLGDRRSAPQSAENRGGVNRQPFDLDRLLEGRGALAGGPITGEDFAPWSDSLREVEELVETPALRNEVTRARERARQFRQDFRRNRKQPDWATVRLQVLKPLVEVAKQIDEELARREPRENLAPIDRDPVPGRFSDLVRRYYERLGSDSAAAQEQRTPTTN